MIENIIFDWSGTLSDDLSQVYLASMLVFKRLGSNPISFEEYKREFTLPYMNFWNKYFPGLAKEEEDKLFSEAIYHVDEPKLYSGVKRTLERLSSSGIRMIILSSHIENKLIYEAKSYGVYDLFQEINGNVHNKTEEINDIIKRNGFEPENTMYVGDMAHDIEAGKEAGVMTVALTWGYQPKDTLERCNPDYIIPHISKLNKLLE